MKLKNKRSFNLLKINNVDKFVRDLYKSLEYECETILNNINPHSIETLYDLAQILYDTALSFDYNIGLTSGDEFYISSNNYEISQPYSIEVHLIVDSDSSIERDFVIMIISYMVWTLYYDSVESYCDSQAEQLEEWIENDPDGEITINDIAEANNELNKFNKLLTKNVKIVDITYLYNQLDNKEPYKHIVDLIILIGDITLDKFSFDIEEHARFQVAMRIEYNFNNILTEHYVNELDDYVNNSGIANPQTVSLLGMEVNEPIQFEPYIELIEELSKIVDEWNS